MQLAVHCSLTHLFTPVQYLQLSS